MNVPRLFPQEHHSVDDGLAKDLASITNYSWGEPMLVIITMHSPSEVTHLKATMHAVYVLTKDGEGKAIVEGMVIGKEYGEGGRALIEKFVEMIRKTHGLRIRISYITKHYRLE